MINIMTDPKLFGWFLFTVVISTIGCLLISIINIKFVSEITKINETILALYEKQNEAIKLSAHNTSEQIKLLQEINDLNTSILNLQKRK